MTGFSPVLRGWFAAMSSDICCMVKANGHLSESFCIARSVRSLSSLLYVLDLDPLSGKLHIARWHPTETRMQKVCGRHHRCNVGHYGNQGVDTTLREFKAVTRAKINHCSGYELVQTSRWTTTGPKVTSYAEMAKRKLSLKGRVVACIHHFHLNIVLLPVSWLIKLRRLFFRLLGI